MNFREFIEKMQHGWGHGWINDRKRKAKHPDFIGYLRMPDEHESVPKGTLLELIGWTNRRNWKRPTMRMRIKVVEDEDAFIDHEIRSREVWREMRAGARYLDDDKRPETVSPAAIKDDADEVTNER